MKLDGVFEEEGYAERDALRAAELEGIRSGEELVEGKEENDGGIEARMVGDHWATATERRTSRRTVRVYMRLNSPEEKSGGLNEFSCRNFIYHINPVGIFRECAT